MQRIDGRSADQLRPVSIEKNYTCFAPGSVLICMGNTKVICTASIEEKVPGFLRGKGEGWLTAEYSMLPGATSQRSERERHKVGGRTMEIQRLIGRSLRSIIDMKKLGERTITVDCDVIQADGGTRTAAITGAYVALALGVKALQGKGLLKEDPLLDTIAAVSVGLIDGQPMLDLKYEEDVRAGVDMNIVITGSGKMVEVQGTGEHQTFSRAELNTLIDLGEKGITELSIYQQKALV